MLVVNSPDPEQYMVKYLWVLVSVNIFCPYVKIVLTVDAKL